MRITVIRIFTFCTLYSDRNYTATIMFINKRKFPRLITHMVGRTERGECENVSTENLTGTV